MFGHRKAIELVADEAGDVGIEALSNCIWPIGRAAEAAGGQLLLVGDAGGARGCETLGDKLG